MKFASSGKDCGIREPFGSDRGAKDTVKSRNSLNRALLDSLAWHSRQRLRRKRLNLE